MTNLSPRDRAFIARFPLVFGPIDQLQPLISYQGIAVHDGWIPLLDQLCCVLTDVIRADQLSFQATQVKEKFGQLRFYAQGGTARTRALIDAAELRSGTICEGCGDTSYLRNRGGLITTICDSCWTSFR